MTVWGINCLTLRDPLVRRNPNLSRMSGLAANWWGAPDSLSVPKIADLQQTDEGMMIHLKRTQKGVFDSNASQFFVDHYTYKGWKGQQVRKTKSARRHGADEFILSIGWLNGIISTIYWSISTSNGFTKLVYGLYRVQLVLLDNQWVRNWTRG